MLIVYKKLFSFDITFFTYNKSCISSKYIFVSRNKIALRFNAADTSNGLLLYCAENDDGTGDFISISLRDRHVEFKYDSGSGKQISFLIGTSFLSLVVL